MKWSYSKSRIFIKCPRRWYFSEYIASPTSRDAFRKEVYILKQLQTMYAWRGSLVDKVIERAIVPGINSRILPSKSDVISFSLELMESQFKFGKEKRYRSEDTSKSNTGDKYCAFYDIEYKGEIDEKILHKVRNDIVLSLENLFSTNFLEKFVENDSYAISQRGITFPFEDIMVSCTPDLLVFSPKAPPVIVDWKVHEFANKDYWLQLGIYALALSKSKPHKDFPDALLNQVQDLRAVRLIEYQLLKNLQREHVVSEDNLAHIFDYICKTSSEMKRLINGGKFDKFQLNRIPTARAPEICEKCNFKKICWEKMPVQKSLFEVAWK